MKCIVFVAVLLTASGCASTSGSDSHNDNSLTSLVTPAYVSPTQYDTWDCDKLVGEDTRLNDALQHRTWGSGWVQNLTTSSHSAEQEISQLKGQRAAIETNITQKKCPQKVAANPAQ